jgi:hypothetical protein
MDLVYDVLCGNRALLNAVAGEFKQNLRGRIGRFFGKRERPAFV